MTRGSWGWTYEGEDRPHATIGYEANLTNVEHGWLRLHYRRNEKAVDYSVQLVTTRPNFGGLRWWFICRSCAATAGRRAAWQALSSPWIDVFRKPRGLRADL